MTKIFDLGLKVFGLRIWITLCYILLGLDWKPFGQRFIFILTRYFTGAGFGVGNTWTWTTNLDYDY